MPVFGKNTENTEIQFVLPACQAGGSFRHAQDDRLVKGVVMWTLQKHKVRTVIKGGNVGDAGYSP